MQSVKQSWFCHFHNLFASCRHLFPLSASVYSVTTTLCVSEFVSLHILMIVLLNFNVSFSPTVYAYLYTFFFSELKPIMEHSSVRLSSNTLLYFILLIQFLTQIFVFLWQNKNCVILVKVVIVSQFVILIIKRYFNLQRYIIALRSLVFEQ